MAVATNTAGPVAEETEAEAEARLLVPLWEGQPDRQQPMVHQSIHRVGSGGLLREGKARQAGSQCANARRALACLSFSFAASVLFPPAQSSLLPSALPQGPRLSVPCCPPQRKLQVLRRCSSRIRRRACSSCGTRSSSTSCKRCAQAAGAAGAAPAVAPAACDPVAPGPYLAAQLPALLAGIFHLPLLRWLPPSPGPASCKQAQPFDAGPEHSLFVAVCRTQSALAAACWRTTWGWARCAARCRPAVAPSLAARRSERCRHAETTHRSFWPLWPSTTLQTLQTVALLSSFAVKDPEARFLVLVPKARGPAHLGGTS